MFSTTRRSLLAVAIPVAALVPATSSGQEAPVAPQQTQVAPVQVDHRCPRGRHDVRDYRQYASKVYRRQRVSRSSHRRLAYILKCQDGARARRWVDRWHHRLKREREERRDPWKDRWLALSPAERAWAMGTARCESGMDPQAVSVHGDHGVMQFKLATAAAAGFVPVDPKAHSLQEQLVRGVWWMRRAGKGQWPVCGAR